MTEPPPALPMDDIPPDFASPDRPPLRCQLAGCQNSVIKPATGRTPKYCPEHKNSSPKQKRVASWPEAERVEKLFAFVLRCAGAGVMMLDKQDGKVIAIGAPAVAHELTELLRLPKFKTQRELISKLTIPGEYGPLMLSLVPIILPILAHHNLLPQFLFPVLTPVPNDISEGGKAS